jgi:hypothetical protein
VVVACIRLERLKNHESHSQVACIPTKIRTGYIHNKGPKRYRYTNLLCCRPTAEVSEYLWFISEPPIRFHGIITGIVTARVLDAEIFRSIGTYCKREKYSKFRNAETPLGFYSCPHKIVPTNCKVM